MSNNNGTETKLKLTCTTCGQVWSEKHHPLEISNNLRSSVVTLAHPSLITCPNQKCSQKFVLLIQGVQAVLNASPVGNDVVQQVEGSSLIVPELKLIN